MATTFRPATAMTDLLLIEDDTKLAQLVQSYLAEHGYRVHVEHRGDRALTAFRRVRPALVILDLMLPGRDGLSLCRDLCGETAVPLLMLTASMEDQVTGLELGADDYVIKPVQPRVLLARIRALLRRQQPGDSTALQFGRLALDPDNRRVTLGGEDLPLATMEFELLLLLARNAGKVMSRDAILNALRGIDFDGLDRSVDVTIGKLRRKLGDEGREARRIKTVWGKGYLFSPGQWED